MRLFMFPFAGGSARVYKPFEKYLDLKEVETILIEYKGHGARSGEAFYENIEACATDVLAQIKGQIQEEPYALFGHSMGGIIIYELVKQIEEQGLRYPSHIFISGRRAPHFKQRKDYFIYKLPEKEFIEEVQVAGGLDEIILRDETLKNYFLPIIRSDYRLIEEYKIVGERNHFKCNMTLCYATEDLEATKEDVLAWKEYGDKYIEVFEFEGGHFYFKEDPATLCNIINNTLYTYNHD